MEPSVEWPEEEEWRGYPLNLTTRCESISTISWTKWWGIPSLILNIARVKPSPPWTLSMPSRKTAVSSTATASELITSHIHFNTYDSYPHHLSRWPCGPISKWRSYSSPARPLHHFPDSPSCTQPPTFWLFSPSLSSRGTSGQQKRKDSLIKGVCGVQDGQTSQILSLSALFEVRVPVGSPL